MTDHDKPETSVTPPAADTAAQPTPETAPAEAQQPAASAPPGRGGKPKGKPPQGGGGTPRRRTREMVPSLEDQMRFQSGPRLQDLDAEIAGELEEALGHMSDKELFGADSSRQVRQQTAKSGTAGRQQGTIVSVHGKDVFVDVPGGRSQGVLSMEQFPEGAPKPGEKVEITIEGYDSANGLLLLSRKGAAMQADWSTVAEGMIVEARVVETNKGGLSVDVNGIRGFMPISQIDLYRVEDAQPFVNQRLLCIVTDADPVERNLVVSRRALLEKQRDELREKVWAELAEGQVRSAVVRKVLEFGAFVDLGGVDALLPISEMSWRHVTDPNTIVQPGQTIKVAVLKLDPEKRKVSVTLKQLEASPWDTIQDKYPAGQVVQGTVSRVADFGAFVELEPGIDGLIHISELARQKVWRVKDIVQEGQAVQVKVLSVDPQQRRISLSLRQAVAAEPVKPAEEEVAAEEVTEPAKPRQRNPNLRGGIGGQQGLLFPEKKD
jgi:small subunit ribosomal protein S1